MDENELEEIKLKMKDLNFGEKLIICTYRAQEFYLELVRENYNELTK